MKKTLFIVKTIFLLAILFSIESKAQLVVKTATLIPFIDANNNCVKDIGEVNVNKSWLMGIKIKNNFATGYSNNNPLNGFGPSYYRGCHDSVYLYVNFANPTLAAATNSFCIYTWEVEPYIQPCFNPDNIAFNTITYVPFKSTLIGREIDFSFKNLNGNKNRNVYSIYKGGSFCKTDSLSLNLWKNLGTSGFGSCSNAQYTGTGPSTLTLKSDGIVIDTYTYNMTYGNYITPLNGNNSYLNSTSQHTTATTSDFLLQLIINPSFVNTYTLGTHTITLIHTPVFGLTQNIVQDFEFVVTNNCAQVVGNAYVDCNNNCMKDGQEAYTFQQISSLNINSATNLYSILPDASGNYNFTSIAPGAYTVSPTVSTNFSLCPFSTNTLNIAPSSPNTINYGVKQATITATDYFTYVMASGANPGPGAVPGGSINISVYNNLNGGNLCLPTIYPGKLKVVLPPLMSFNGAIGLTTAPSSIIPTSTGDTIVWNTPLITGLHQFSAVTATNAVIGNAYCIKAIINPLVDGDPSNNTSSFCRNYGGPFDPNDKTAEALNILSNGDILPSTTDITYTIRFQNLGNGPAVNVVIQDTMSTNLNLSSLEILDSSFPVSTQINNTSRRVTFNFTNIFLQSASTNETASHGFVKYKIKLNNGLPLGTQIKNRAYIYFDYNAAVATNQTINTIAMPMGINVYELASTINLYPNPTNGNLLINSAANINEIVIFNTVGKMVFEKQNVNAQNTTINIAGLSQGIYFVQLHTINGIVTKKIIKD